MSDFDINNTEPRSGEKENFYSDAHYSPAGEDTAPYRYYTPRSSASKDSSSKEAGKVENDEKKQRDHRSSLLSPRVIALCLICAVLGGIGGAAFVAKKFNEKFEEFEGLLNSLPTATPIEAYSENDTVLSANDDYAVSIDAEMTPNEIYLNACSQVVGVTTEVTYRNFFGMKASSPVSGTGFFISDNGYILTNFHVIEYAYEYGYSVYVVLYDGTSYNAEIVGVESENDIAVLKIDATGTNPAEMGNSDVISVGEIVYAVGNPLGELDFTMTTGSVSALNREISTETGTAINMFQIDAAVNSGNSGGPVYNSKGEVIGVVTAKSKGTGIEGLGFAIPANDALKISNDLISNGYVTGKPFMGITIDDEYSSVYKQYYNMPAGVYVRSVTSGSAAEKAGIKVHDIITKMADVQLGSRSDLTSEMKNYFAGDTVTIEVFRSGETISLEITFDEAGRNESSPTMSSNQLQKSSSSLFSSGTACTAGVIPGF